MTRKQAEKRLEALGIVAVIARADSWSGSLDWCRRMDLNPANQWATTVIVQDFCHEPNKAYPTVTALFDALTEINVPTEED